MNIDAIREAVFRLSHAEKLRLVHDLWDDLARTPEAVPISERQFEELECRRLALELNPGRAIDWEQAKRMIQGSARGGIDLV